MAYPDYAFFSSQTGAPFEGLFLESGESSWNSLSRYLQSRRQTFVRDSSQITLRNEDPAHFLRAIEVVDDALRLVARFRDMADAQRLLPDGRERMKADAPTRRGG